MRFLPFLQLVGKLLVATIANDIQRIATRDVKGVRSDIRVVAQGAGQPRYFLARRHHALDFDTVDVAVLVCFTHIQMPLAWCDVVAVEKSSRCPHIR